MLHNYMPNVGYRNKIFILNDGEHYHVTNLEFQCSTKSAKTREQPAISNQKR